MSKLEIAGDAVVAELMPERGGIVTRVAVGGDEVFYLDPATLAGPKVRGGNPVLFPNPGPLAGGVYRAGDRTYELGQHGFAREMPWQVVRAERNLAELRLATDDATRRRFPFEFDIRLIYTCAGDTFTIEQIWNNLGDEPMPLHFGFHPYFAVADADKGAVTISTDATRAYDNVTKKEVPFGGFDLTRPEVDLHLIDHGPKEAVITRPGHRSLRLHWGDLYRCLVVWTLQGKDFVCVEPWTARANALNTGEGLVYVDPHTNMTSFMAITAL